MLHDASLVPPSTDLRWITLGQRARITAYQLNVLQEGYGEPPPGLAWHREPNMGVLICLYRVEGMNRIGLWQNPACDRCLQLSIAFHDPDSGDRIPFLHAEAEAIVTGAFGAHRVACWVEPPIGLGAQVAGTHSYRLFLEPDWRTPVAPGRSAARQTWAPAHWRSWAQRSSVEVPIL